MQVHRSMTVREATPSDARDVALIHVRSWRVAYRGILPPEVLKRLSVESRAQRWEERLERGGSLVLVAREGNRIVGWAAAGPSRDKDAGPRTGELYGLYVDPERWRAGAGRTLWALVRTRLKRRRFADATLWVLAANLRARAFYEAVGFTQDPRTHKNLDLEGHKLRGVRYRISLERRAG